jgi:hypothetical protein
MKYLLFIFVLLPMQPSLASKTAFAFHLENTAVVHSMYIHSAGSSHFPGGLKEDGPTIAVFREKWERNKKKVCKSHLNELLLKTYTYKSEFICHLYLINRFSDLPVLHRKLRN